MVIALILLIIHNNSNKNTIIRMCGVRVARCMMRTYFVFLQFAAVAALQNNKILLNLVRVRSFAQRFFSLSHISLSLIIVCVDNCIGEIVKYSWDILTVLDDAREWEYVSSCPADSDARFIRTNSATKRCGWLFRLHSLTVFPIFHWGI